MENKKEYGVAYIKPVFKRGDKYYWLNYAFSTKSLLKPLRDDIKSVIKSINDKYFEHMLIPMDLTHFPGCIANPEYIEEIVNETFDNLNSLFEKFEGDGCYFRAVWGVGELDNKDEILKQATRIKDVPTIHHINSYDIIVKVGRTLDSSKKCGIYKI